MSKSTKSTRELQRRVIEDCRSKLFEQGLVISRIKDIQFEEKGPEDYDYPHYYDISFLADHDPETDYSKPLQLKVTCKLLVLMHHIGGEATFVYQMKPNSLTYSLVDRAPSK